MKQFTFIIMVWCLSFCSTNVFAQCACATGNCDFIITTAMSEDQLYLTATKLKNAMGVPSLEGKKICIQAGTYTDKKITFHNIEGTAENPIIIKNCGGQVIINNENGTTLRHALAVWDSKYVKILGNACSAAPERIRYGIRAKSNTNFVEAKAVEGRITDIEIAWLDVGGDSGTKGDAGIKIIDEPGCDEDTISNRNSPARKVIRNISVHDNYVHNIDDEGIYIGKGDRFYTYGDFPKNCTKLAWSVSIKGVRIYNNRIEHTGWDGLQLKDADEDVKIYNNDIGDYGIDNNDGQNEGIILGAGVVGDVYHNRIINGSGTGFFYKGLSNLNFHNNLIVNAGKEGIYMNGDHGVRVADDNYIRIINNTIVKTGDLGIEMYEYDTVENRVLVNNIFAEVNTVSGTYTEKTNNYETGDANNVRFVNYNESSSQDFLTNDYHLQAASPAVDSGKNASGYGADSIAYDFDGAPRNINGKYDIGCYEFQGSNPNESTTLLINTGGAAFNEWEADNPPHSTLDNSFPTAVTGSQFAFGGPNATSAPNQVLGTYRYTTGSNNTIRYNIPVAISGEAYKVELFFARKTADTFGSGARRFNIILEGGTPTIYDVFDNGGIDGKAASSYSKTVTVNDGMLEVKLVAVSGAIAMINAIKVEGPVETAQASVAGRIAVEPEVKGDRKTGIFPNPAYDQINVVSADEEIIGIKIIGAQNEIYLSAPLQIKAGESVTLDISGLPENQLYFVHLRSTTGTRSFKLIRTPK